MSKLNLDAAVPRFYDSAVFTGIIRAICQQVNLESEGRLAARYQAQASVPSSVAAAVGDIVWDSNVTVTSGTARLGWVCNVASPTNATWQEIRVLTASGQYAFPSTQTPSSDPNTLDDYEEGTWTPSVGGTATYTTQSG